MRDGPLRRFIKAIAAWRYRTDLACTRAWARVRGEAPRFELHGHCNGCGACCETPMIHVNRWVYHSRSLRAVILWWQHRVNGFEYLASDRQQHAFIFRCTHFDPVSRLCDAYGSRPGMCRDYPRNLLDDPDPQFLPPCSYYPLACRAAELRAALREQALAPAKLADLEQRLHLVPPAAARASDPPPEHAPRPDAAP